MQIPIDKNIFISAGAGTGKTHILVQRFIELLSQDKAEVSQIVAITFTEKAAHEMKDRIRDACTQERHKRELENSRIGTIHGFCARLIKENPIEVGIDPTSRILDETESLTLLDKVVHNQILDLVNKEDEDTVFMVSEYGFKKTKNTIKTLVKNRHDIDNINENEYILSIYKKAKNGYEAYKQTDGLLDFDDLIIYTKRLLKENESIRRHYQKIIKYILVDEFQDTDFHQREIIFYLAEDRDKLFIVGDSKQSIYRFRGADVSVFEDTRRLFEKNGKVLNLNINMRTVQQNIEFFNALFGKIMSHGKEDYECSYTELLPFRKDSTGKPAIEFLMVEPEDDDSAKKVRMKEAELISRKILHLVNMDARLVNMDARLVNMDARLQSGKKIQFKDIAVLFRAMTDVKLYEDAFRRYNIPYYVIAGSGFFARQEIKDILNYLKVLDNENDKIALAGVLRSPMFGLSDDELYWWVREKKLPEEITELRDLKEKISISSLIQEIVKRTNYNAVLATQYMGEQRISNVNKLIETARRFEAEGIFTLTDFIKYLDLLVLNEAREGEAAVSEEESNVVKIMTIHKAKGLEFPVVIIPDIHRKPRPAGGPVLFDKKYNFLGVKVKDKDGEFQESPQRALIKKEIEKKELAESKRLLYVASTRARDYLIYSGVFSGKENTWANWLWEFSDKVKVTTHIPPPDGARLSPTRRTSSALSASGVLRQVQTISPGPRLRVTATEPGGYISRYGISVHEFLKKWDFSEKDIPDFVLNLVKHPIYEEIKTAIEIKRELPITYKHNDKIVEGVIDLLYKKKDGNWVILDYKTDNITKEEAPIRARSYEDQLRMYAMGVNKILGITPEKIVIFFLTPGIAYTLP